VTGLKRLLSTSMLLIALLTMSACSQSPVRSDPARVSEYLLMDCPDLPLPEGDGLAEIAQLLIEVAGEYHDCADRHQALAEIVRGQEK